MVTAERREEKLRDVPIAVTSFNAASLQSRDITDIRGIQGFIPNVAIVQSPGYQTESDIAIRGGVTINPAPYWDPTAGLYVNGVYIPKAIGNVTDLADIDHIEVLRGPQGTLYGRNTLGGAVNIVTQKPTGELEGYITAGAGNYGEKEVRGNINLPAFGALKLALSGVMVGHDGYVNTVQDPDHLAGFFGSSSYLGKFDSLNSRTGRVEAELDLTDDFYINYAFDVSYQKDTPNYSQLTRVGLVGSGPTPLFDPASPAYSEIPLGLYIQHNPGPSNAATANGGYDGTRPFEVASVRAHALTATWDVTDELELKSISSYRQIDWSNNLDLDGSPLPVAGTELFTHYRAASEEIQATGQIDRFHYTAGLFYFQDDGFTQNPQQFFVGAVNYLSAYGYGTQNFAGYGQVDYNPPILDDKLTITFGLRYSNESKFGSRFESYNGFTIIPNINASKNYDSTTPAAVVKYALTDDVNVYAKYAEGFKSGGFNGEAPSLAEAVTPFAPETVDEYEVGIKSRWLDGKLSANVAAFYDQHSNLQLSVFLGNGSASSVVRNAGSANIDGLEFDLQALPTPWLTLSGQVGYLNTEYVTFINNGVNVANGTAFPYAPQFTASMSADATLMDNDFGKLHFIVDYRHSDAYYEYPYSEAPTRRSTAAITPGRPRRARRIWSTPACS